ncbi:MAG: DUF4982 domain-containing protein [Cyclobacteriaceae bacterium]
MKYFSGLFLVVAALYMAGCSSVIVGQKNSFNQDWKFLKVDEADSANNVYMGVDFSDKEWEDICLPHTTNIEPILVNDQWQGVSWYRKHFGVDGFGDGQNVYLELEAAMNTADIWLNGEKVDRHEGGYLPVVVDITKYIKSGDENLLAIKLDNRDNKYIGPKPLRILDYNTYGGLYRNAWLITKGDVHITHPVLANKTAGGGVFITYPKVSTDKSIVQVKTHIENTGNSKNVVVVNEIYAGGKLVKSVSSSGVDLASGEDREFVEKIEIANPNLWSPKSPFLYELKTRVHSDGKEVEVETNRFGIRELVFKGMDLYVNGEKTFLRGVNRHQEYPYIGYALSDNAQYRDAKKIRDGGFNFIRLSHYPHSPSFMDACDELGILTLDAISGWQYYLEDEKFKEYCYRSARELILRDRNRPSVLAWEVSLNETQMPIPFMEKLHKITHDEFPGENVYSCGWQPEVYDLYLQARQHRIMHYDSIHTKPYEVSEYGDWEYFSGNAGLNQHNHSREKRTELSSRQARGYGEERLLIQYKNVKEAHNDNLNFPSFGDSYWAMYDYNRGYAKTIEYSGVMDLFRIPKFAYYFYQSQRDISEGEVLHIASWWTKDSPLEINVFSNCEEVELLVNGKSVGKKKPTIDVNSTNLSHPPFVFDLDAFEAGELNAVGYINGKKVAEHSVKTPEEIVGLKIWIDECGRAPEAGVNDVVFAYIAAVDQNGTIVPSFSEPLDIAIDGDAQLMNYNNEVLAEAGIGTALLRIEAEASNVILTASAAGMKVDYSLPIK